MNGCVDRQRRTVNWNPSRSPTNECIACCSCSFPAYPAVLCVCLSAIDYQLSVVSALHFENEVQHQKAVPTAIRQSLSLAGTVEVWHRGWTMRLPRTNHVVVLLLLCLLRWHISVCPPSPALSPLSPSHPYLPPASTPPPF